MDFFIEVSIFRKYIKYFMFLVYFDNKLLLWSILKILDVIILLIY